MEELLHPSLAPLVAEAGLDPTTLQAAVSLGTHGAGPRSPRETILLSSGKDLATWQVPSLRSLFRGDRVPPSMSEYPKEYVPAFFMIEQHVRSAAHAGQAYTDAEIDEAFSNLRRRPDGRSMGAAHDLLWRASALTLGRFVLSEAEYCAIVGRLARSAGGWKQGPSSREYVGFLMRTFG